MAQALDGDLDAVEIATAQRRLDGRLDADADTARGERRRITARFALTAGNAGDVLRLGGDDFHIGDRHADVLGGDILPTQAVDGAAERLEDLDAVFRDHGPADHRLAAAHGEVGHGVLVTHALG